MYLPDGEGVSFPTSQQPLRMHERRAKVHDPRPARMPAHTPNATNLLLRPGLPGIWSVTGPSTVELSGSLKLHQNSHARPKLFNG